MKYNFSKICQNTLTRQLTWLRLIDCVQFVSRYARQQVPDPKQLYAASRADDDAQYVERVSLCAILSCSHQTS